VSDGDSQSRLGKLRSDVVAGLINAVVSVPDGLASAALAGVNPVYGLYTSIAAPIAGSLLASTRLMQVATTSASALAAGQAVAGYPEDERGEAIFLLAILTGVMLAIFGLLRFGRLVRFVSHSVMTGFLIGVAVVLILDQLAPVVGYSPDGANSITQFLDLISNAADFDGQTIVIGVLALAIVFGLQRTPLASLASLVALLVPTVLVALMGWERVRLVDDVSSIPRGVPTPGIPDPTLISLDLLLAAFSVAVVIAVQGAGVGQSVENPDDEPSDPSRDMIAQGAANVASGLLSGIPAGGSVGQTALNVSVGARSRWAGVLSGLWMLAIVLLIPGLVGQVPMAVLGALMIQAGISAINTDEAKSIWSVGGPARWLIGVTFVATLLLSVPVAVAVGVVLAILLFLFSSASDIRVRALEPTADGGFIEREPPETLPSETTTVLDVYGSLFFAGARTLAERLPRLDDTERPTVVLRLRGRTRAGATLVDVLDNYAEDLAEVGGRLYLSGVDDDLVELLKRSGLLKRRDNVEIISAQSELGASTERAIDAARQWHETGE
jgi:SulP family sulfate permease